MKLISLSKILIPSFVFLSVSCTDTGSSSKSKKTETPTETPEEQETPYPMDPNAAVYNLRAIPTTEDVKSAFENHNPVPNKKPNIFLFVVDTMRRDHVTPNLTPNTYDFANDANAVTFKNMSSNAVSTYFSQTALYHSVHGMARPYMMDDDFTAGSINLNVLKSAGYDIHLFGRPNNNFCFEEDHDAFTPQYWNNRFLYSNEPIDFMGGRCQPYAKTKKNYARNDHLFVSAFKNEFQDILFNYGDKANLFIFWLDGVHAPYTFPKDEIGKVYEPFFQGVPGETLFTDKEDRKAIKNAYKNAVQGADYQFGRVINKIKSKGMFDESMIVIMSDHGERLFSSHYQGDDRFKTAHSGIGYNELLDNVFYMKFPAGSLAEVQSLDERNTKDQSVGIKDIFPTIFDYLGVDYPAKMKEQLVGQSLFKDQPKYCQANYSPDWDRPPYFTFRNKDKKVYVKMEREKKRSRQVAFKIMHYFDENDRTISAQKLKENYQITDPSDRKQQDKFLLTHFKDCMDQVVVLGD